MRWASFSYFRSVEPWTNFELEDIPGERWLPVVAFDGLYEVSDLGRVKSLERWVERPQGGYWAKPRIRRPGKVKHPGGQFSFYVPLTDSYGHTKNYTLARLVVESFGGGVDEGYSIHHINGKSHDNRWCNLSTEDLSVKRKIEFDLGLRENVRIASRNLPQSIALADKMRGTKGMPSHVTEAVRPKTFRQRNAMVVTVVIPAQQILSVFTSIRSASEATGVKEHTLRNALNKPHKYKRLSVLLGAHYQDSTGHLRPVSK